MSDASVIAACLDSRDAYDRVSGFVDEREFTPMAGFWWKLVVDWYSGDDNAVAVDRGLLRQKGSRRVGEKLRETMLQWFDDLPSSVSPDNAVSELIAVKRHALGNELAIRIGDDPKKLVPMAQQYVALLQAETLEHDTWIESGGIQEIVASLSDEGKIKLLPLALNERCRGGATPGDHIVIFGPTEIGKSLLAINMVAGFLRQGQRVLYLSNEDAAWKFDARLLSNLSNRTYDEVLLDPKAAVEKARSKGYGNLLVGNMAPGNVAQIERKVEEHNADIVVVDQLRNLHATGKSGSLGITQRIDAVAQEFRSLLIRKQLIGVSLLQAYAGEHGKPTVWYSADDVDSSRVGAPASADLLIALGADDAMLHQNIRAVSICKNKLGDVREGFLVKVDTKRSKAR